MKIRLQPIKISDLFDGFVNSEEEGVFGYHGKLNIRPKYQREFVYKNEQRNAVIETIRKNFPLNAMYWVENEDGTYELLDGQQRTISICSFLNKEFMLNWNGNLKGWVNLTETEQQQINDYELMVYICSEGTDEEKIEWFKVINIAGEKLTNQEILNAVYSGQWVTEAKRKFSKTGCVAYKLGSDYMSGNPIRQDYLETANSIDRSVSKIMSAIKEEGLEDNTVFIYTSSGTLSGGSSLNVPLIIRMPKDLHIGDEFVTGAGEISSTVSDKDLVPTILHFAGEDFSQLSEGKSLVNDLLRRAPSQKNKGFSLSSIFRKKE